MTRPATEPEPTPALAQAPSAEPLAGRALSPDMEERWPEDEARGEHHEYASRDDAHQRPPLRLGRVLDRPHDDPDQEPGGGQGKNPDQDRVPGIAEDTAPVVHRSEERRV